MSSHPIPKEILILGGGTAGWMAACLFNHHWGAHETSVTVVESLDIGIIGVGEGSTPQLKDFFDTLGIAETEWMPRCHATYKTGISFRGWSQRPGFEAYFHPFPTTYDRDLSPKFFSDIRLRQSDVDVAAHPDPFFLPPILASQLRAPIVPAGSDYQVSYGYHFDAHLVGAFLRKVATSRGVKHIEATIAAVKLAEDGSVAGLVARDGRRLAADLYVDCSGFRAAIVEQALREPHLSFQDNLFNDRAVVLPTPVNSGGPECATRSTALTAGWAWHIPLTNRSGNGYVYSSRFIDDQSAERELRKHTGAGHDVEALHLKMRVGRLQRCWVKNALAVGLSQGFVEPLEATSLHVVISTLEIFISTMGGLGDTERSRKAFNNHVAARVDAIRDYLVCHYRMAQRKDSEYWRAATTNDHLSDSLRSIIQTWNRGGDLAREISRQGIGRYYSAMSWHCLLAGYGAFPGAESAANVRHAPSKNAETTLRFLMKVAARFPTHRKALDGLQREDTETKAL